MKSIIEFLNLSQTHLKVELEFATHGRTEAVEKLAELRACDVILHISGVEVVSSIENSHTDSRSSSSHFGNAPLVCRNLS